MIVCILIPDWLSAIAGPDPVILIGGSERVQGASFSVAQAGVRVGMRLRQAHALFPTASLMPFDEKPFLKKIDQLYSLLADFTHKQEIVMGFWNKTASKRKEPIHPSAAIVYMDIGKHSRRDALDTASRIQAVCQTENLPVAIGLGSGKFVAAVAARYVEVGQIKLIGKGHEPSFLSQYPASLLPLDKEMSRKLNLLGIRSLGQLADLPAGAVLNQFGKQGKFLHGLAQGKDNRPVIERPPKQTECVTEVLEGGVEDRFVMETLLQNIGCILEERLKAKGNTTQHVTLELKLDDHTQLRFDRVLREVTHDGRLLGRTLLRLLSNLEFSAGIVEIAVIADQLAPLQMRQLDLFSMVNHKEHSLTTLLDNLSMRFGGDSLFQISEGKPDHWLPEGRFQWEEVA
jgi:nucleotidyltransferase/DNA polymerase involved in DNA repair